MMDGETNVYMIEVHSLSNQIRINSEHASKNMRCIYAYAYTYIYTHVYVQIFRGFLKFK